MKLGTVVTLMIVLGAAYWATDGGSMFQRSAPTELPDTISPPNATFMGNEQANPYAK